LGRSIFVGSIESEDEGVAYICHGGLIKMIDIIPLVKKKQGSKKLLDELLLQTMSLDSLTELCLNKKGILLPKCIDSTYEESDAMKNRRS
jgi:hypothetical protein